MANNKKFFLFLGLVALVVLDFLLFSTITTLVRQPSTNDVGLGLGLLLIGGIANYYLFVRYFRALFE